MLNICFQGCLQKWGLVVGGKKKKNHTSASRKVSLSPFWYNHQESHTVKTNITAVSPARVFLEGCTRKTMCRFVHTAYVQVRKGDARFCQIVCSWSQLCCPSTRAPPVQAHLSCSQQRAPYLAHQFTESPLQQLPPQGISSRYEETFTRAPYNLITTNPMLYHL